MATSSSTGPLRIRVTYWRASRTHSFFATKGTAPVMKTSNWQPLSSWPVFANVVTLRTFWLGPLLVSTRALGLRSFSNQSPLSTTTLPALSHFSIRTTTAPSKLPPETSGVTCNSTPSWPTFPRQQVDQRSAPKFVYPTERPVLLVPASSQTSRGLAKFVTFVTCVSCSLVCAFGRRSSIQANTRDLSVNNFQILP